MTAQKIRMALDADDLDVLEDILHMAVRYPSVDPLDMSPEEHAEHATAARLLARVSTRREALAGRLP